MDAAHLQILENEIAPKFNKLREAKRAFLEYQKLDNELGHLSRFISAYEFVKYQVRIGFSKRNLLCRNYSLKQIKNLPPWMRDNCSLNKSRITWRRILSNWMPSIMKPWKKDQRSIFLLIFLEWRSISRA